MDFLWRYLDGGLPGRPGDSIEQARLMRARLLNGISGLFVLIATPFLLLLLADGRTAAATSLGVSISLASANVLLLRKTHWVSFCGLIFASLILAHLSHVALEIRHPALAYWFFMIPLLGALLGGLRAGWLLTGIVLLVATYQQLVPVLDSPELSNSYVFSMRIVSTLCVAVFMTIFATAQRAAERSQRAANQELRNEAGRGKLMREVAGAANSAAEVTEVLQTCVESVCRLTHWPVGVAWTVGGWDEANKVDGNWVLGNGRLTPTRKIRRIRSCAERIWAEGRCVLSEDSRGRSRPTWIEALAGELDPQLNQAVQAAGLSGGVLVPVLDEGEVVARLAFFWGPDTQPDTMMLAVLENLGAQVAHVVVRIRAQARIQALAYFDPLTGLPNRQLFRRRLQATLEMAKRNSNPFALLFIDLDGFKAVNDSLGHGVGDRLLQEVARRLVAGVRASDAVIHGQVENLDGEVSRLAGDEFTITLIRISNAEDAGCVAQRLIDALGVPFDIGDHEIYVSASIGVATYPADGENPETLLAASDAAMYRAKELGRGQFQYYTHSMNVDRARCVKLEARLRRALERGDLSLCYQPFRDTAGAVVVAAEALVRWQDEELGAVSPSEFIPIAERTGLIVEIGSWILQTACEQMRCWLNQGYLPLRISVNVSAIQVQRGRLAEEVAALLTQNRLSPDHLELEITESTIMHDDETTRRSLEEIDALGVGITLDDFGVGFSSLSYLRRFPIGCVKIDRSFVSGIPEVAEDATLTAAVIAMAHSLGLRVVAEGVETVAQADFLRSHRCDELQGYLFGRPVPAEEFTRFLQRDKSDQGAADG